MNFFEDSILQARKRRHLVCGDYYLCSRTPEATLMVLCDGIGSGVYANVAAITCGNRLAAMLEGGRSLRSACAQVAESMTRARSEEMPFSAFIAVRILPGGQYTAYAYENPGAILIHGGMASVCPVQYISLKYEMLAEMSGTLALGDSLLICSDGVTHAGLGGGFATGWDLPGVQGEINAYLRGGGRMDGLLSRILRTSYNLSGKAYWDDTSLAMATCREARPLSVLTGPPSSRADDARVVRLFEAAPGGKIICGSTTTDIASRVLGRKATIKSMDLSLDRPPEYAMEGIDLITEGAVTLNQALNLLEAGVDYTLSDSTVFRLCQALTDADIITFFVGGGYNAEQEEDMLLRQLGVKPRQRVVQRIADYLRERGKLVVTRSF